MAVLVVTEKPSVAQSIAHVVGAGGRKDGYMEGNGYLVSWCIGHLVELAQPDAYSDAWKKWDYESLPMIPEQWQTEVKSGTAAQYKVLKKLMHDDRVDTVVEATDAGREGELIFRLVYDQAGCRKPIKRLWISSMEESAIREGFANLRPGSDYDNLYHSALCRQRADWLVGLNGTRLFTVLYGGKVLKVGRVQTPTLAMLVEREEKIRNFKKEPYYTAHILTGGMDAATEKIAEKAQAEGIAAACESKTATVVSVTKEKKTVQPPKLYDLTSLQRDANRLFGFTAKQTLEYTQSLYEKKLVTYPRTDSQYLSDDMEDTARAVIGAVYKAILFEELSGAEPDIKRVMDSKKVTDHHAIIPTMEIAKVGAGFSPKEKFRKNIEAIRTLEKIEGENRIATPEEQKILAQYVGWGGLADAFDQSKSAWAGEYQELKSLLSDAEYASARESTLNAHYTSPVIIRSIYEALEHMGFEKGNVLEPAMGIGNFFGMLPENMQESRLYGVELDGITGRIAKQLYPKAKGFGCRVNACDNLRFLNGTLREHIRLAHKFAFLVRLFKGA